ncbi:MAG: hypothetical protein IJ555_13710 [Ruminococcus sp.]|nr:hypothetical protein [Ruminococcus sp.]
MIYLLGSIPNPNFALLLDEQINVGLSTLTKRDILIFYSSDCLLSSEEFVSWLSERPYTSVILDADDTLHKSVTDRQITSRFGSRAYAFADSVFVIPDCGMYKISGKKILICSLGRAEGRFKKEYIARTEKQMIRFSQACKRHDFTADYVITRIPPHIVSSSVAHCIGFDMHSLFLDKLAKHGTFERWFFTSLKTDKIYMDKYYCVHSNITGIDGSKLIKYSDMVLDK